jgi:hypothetical protein
MKKRRFDRGGEVEKSAKEKDAEYKRREKEYERQVQDIENRVMEWGPYGRKERMLALLDPRRNYYTDQMKEDVVKYPAGMYKRPITVDDPRSVEPWTPPLYTHPLRSALYGANRLVKAWTGRDYYDEARNRLYTASKRGVLDMSDTEPIQKKRGGAVKAPSRGDGIARKGKTKGRYL